METSQLIAFIIPTSSRPELLKKCLISIHSAFQALTSDDTKMFRFQVRIVFNGEKKTKSEIESLIVNCPSMEIKTYFVAKMPPSESRNRAVKEEKADYFYFIDDDTCLPTDFLAKVCHILKSYPQLEIFGGPDSCVPNVGFLEKSLELALRSPLTTLKTRKRHSPKDAPFEKGDEQNLILCNLCVRQNIFFEKGIYFPEDYFRNEENVFLIKLKANQNILYFPYLYIFHERRPNLRNVYKAASCSGFYRLKMIAECKGYHQLIFLPPLFFILYLSSLSIFLVAPLSLIYFFPLILYFVLNFLSSLKLSFSTRNYFLLPIVCFYQLYIILSYGIGLFKGLLSMKYGFKKIYPGSAL